MADEVPVSISSPHLPSISTLSSSSDNSIPSISTNIFQTTILPPSTTPQTTPPQTTPPQTTSPHDNRSAPPPQQLNGLPLLPIIGAGAGVLLILLAVGVWYFLRRRRQRRKEAKSGFSIVFPDPKGSFQSDHDRQRRSRSRARNSNNSNNSNKVGDEQRISVDSFPGRSYPGDQSSIHDNNTIDLEMALPLHSNILPFPDSPYSRPRQPPIIPVNPRSQPPTSGPVPPPRLMSIPMTETATSSPEKEEEEVSEKLNYINIDMASMDLSTSMPVVASDEAKPTVQTAPQAQVAQEYKADASLACTQPSSFPAAATETEDASRASTDTIMPTPVPRRPKLIVQNSSDSFIQGGRARISIAYPPPPPPTIPPPAIPSGKEQQQDRVSTESSYRSSIYSTSNQSAGGRRPRTSTESPRIPCSRRSVSMDAASFTPDGRRLSRKLVPPPNTPPPSIPLPPRPPVPLATPSPSSTPISSTPHQALPRRRHQRNPSQILSTSLFDSSDRSVISPPLSPLTIQIPRPSSRSFQSLLTINTQLTAENVQQYLQQQQPQPLEIYKPDSPTDSIFAVSPRTSSLYHTPRSRSRSATQLETQRIMVPPSPVTATALPASSSFSPPMPPVPAMPSSLADHLPSLSPRSTSSQSYIAFKRPPLSHQQSYSSLDNPRTDTTAPDSTRHNQYHYGADENAYHHDYQHYERGAHSPEPKKRHQKQHRRRSMSAPTSPSPSSPSSPSSSRQRESSTSPSGRRSKEESVRAATATPTSTKDQELQAIIADAIAIAAAKTAAIETARQNNFSRQSQTKQQQHHQYLQQHHQYQQQQYQQRRVHPQMDPWRSTTPSTADSSRPGSPL